MKLKIDGAKALSIGATVLGVVGALLSSKVDSNNRKAMKSEIKEELMKMSQAIDSLNLWMDHTIAAGKIDKSLLPEDF